MTGMYFWNTKALAHELSSNTLDKSIIKLLLSHRLTGFSGVLLRMYFTL